MIVHWHGSWRHLVGLLVATVAAGLIALVFEYGPALLDGTPFEELQYVIFGVAAIGMLSGLHALMAKFMD
ncbi:MULTISPECIES: hypothetical protein [unclassified Rhizobium]|jgi:hypothetical protein|uniref:hypothetical protein n=1 Tax=unclassified Rhizobium TaxID=2613769 RepID=UPI000647D32E|nr:MULTISPECIES: hypothetical protein [unclassified Rhizobium]MBN8954768.1 hypothetical protein [Rhizobium tropici]OJY72031.1 MAG: hypothetical protein BGP09_25090 [Rhizobium sp. 60-20]RKD35928.1 hypothetical protein BJ928_1277 [Rhizobium sp. WW_1]